MKNSIIYTTLLLMLISIAACRCDKQEAIYSNGAELYRYVFKDTTTWVYRNTATNVFDTVVMYKMERAFKSLDTADKCIELKKEIFSLRFRSSLNPAKDNFYFVDYNGIRLNGDGDPPYPGREIYNRLTQVGDSTESTRYVEFINPLNIENQTYNNVRKIEILFGSEEYPRGTFLYWSPNLGIVRKEIHTDNGIEYWNLTYSEIKYYD